MLAKFQLPRSVQFAIGSNDVFRLNMQLQRQIRNGNTKTWPSSFVFLRIRRTWSFHVVVLQRTAKKWTEFYNARARALLCSLNLLFKGVLVAAVVEVCSSSVLLSSWRLAFCGSIFYVTTLDKRKIPPYFIGKFITCHIRIGSIGLELASNGGSCVGISLISA